LGAPEVSVLGKERGSLETLSRKVEDLRFGRKDRIFFDSNLLSGGGLREPLSLSENNHAGRKVRTGGGVEGRPRTGCSEKLLPRKGGRGCHSVLERRRGGKGFRIRENWFQRGTQGGSLLDANRALRGGNSPPFLLQKGEI